MVMESEFVEPINLGNPDEVTIEQIAREVRDCVPGTRSEIVYLP